MHVRFSPLHQHGSRDSRQLRSLWYGLPEKRTTLPLRVVRHLLSGKVTDRQEDGCGTESIETNNDIGAGAISGNHNSGEAPSYILPGLFLQVSI